MNGSNATDADAQVISLAVRSSKHLRSWLRRQNRSRGPAINIGTIRVHNAIIRFVSRVGQKAAMGPAFRPSAELKLSLDLCRYAFCGTEGIELPALDNGIDWDTFVRQVRFHRVEGLAWNGLAASADGIPKKVRRDLSTAATEIAIQNMRMAVECRELLNCFETAGVPLLFLKGLTAGALAYANPALKAAVDIDLLVDPADLEKAAALLRQRDYQLQIPRSRETALRSWHRRSKESVWWKQSPPLQVDLHTRTADNPRLIPAINVRSPRQLVDIGHGIQLPTLGSEEVFAYLAVHGTATVWFRLKWISDFAGLIHAKGIDEINHLYRRSQQLGAGRTTAQALLLADLLFGTLGQQSALRDELLRDKANRSLLRTARRFICVGPVEPTEQRFGTLPMHWTPFLFRSGPAYWLSELSAQGGRLINRLKF